MSLKTKKRQKAVSNVIGLVGLLFYGLFLGPVIINNIESQIIGYGTFLGIGIFLAWLVTKFEEIAL